MAVEEFCTNSFVQCTFLPVTGSRLRQMRRYSGGRLTNVVPDWGQSQGSRRVASRRAARWAGRRAGERGERVHAVTRRHWRGMLLTIGSEEFADVHLGLVDVMVLLADEVRIGQYEPVLLALRLLEALLFCQLVEPSLRTRVNASVGRRVQ